MRITVKLAPEPQRRGKIVQIGKFKSIGRTERQELAEAQLVSVLSLHRPAEPMEGALHMQVIAYLPIPKSFGKKKRLEAMSGLLMPDKKPDRTNLIKHLEDCMTKIGYWNDDAQIVSGRDVKFYDDGKGPRWEIAIITWQQYVAKFGLKGLRSDH